MEKESSRIKQQCRKLDACIIRDKRTHQSNYAFDEQHDAVVAPCACLAKSAVHMDIVL